MLDHYVMFRLKPVYKSELSEVVKRLKSLEARVPAIRFSDVMTDCVHGPHSYDVMFHIRVDSIEAFRTDYMLHPEHVPVQHYIEARVEAIADMDVES